MSEVRLSNTISITGEVRWDSEYYLKNFLANETILQKYETKKLSELCNFIKKGIFDLPPDNYIEKGVPLIRTSEIKNPTIDFSTTVYISDEINRNNNKTILQPNDIVFTKIGAYIGDVALLPNTFSQYNFSQNVAGASVKNKNNSAFYLAFFLSKIGRNQILRSAMLSGQGKLELEDIRNYKIPIITEKLNTNIKNIFQKREDYINRSQYLYNEAENLLLETIGLKNFKPSEKGINVKTFKKSFLTTGRLDAEYYQPKYEEVERKVKKTGFVYLEDICSAINYGSVPTSPYTENDEGIPYIKGLNLKSTFIIRDKLDYIVNTEKLTNKVFTKEGDIIISQMGTVGDVGIVTRNEAGWIFASFTIRVRLKKDCGYLPRFIGLYIQNIAKNYYLKQNIAQASVRQNTDLPTIKRMYIPKVDIDIQKQIVDLIDESFSLRRKSERLLEEAKEMVEKEMER